MLNPSGLDDCFAKATSHLPTDRTAPRKGPMQAPAHRHLPQPPTTHRMAEPAPLRVGLLSTANISIKTVRALGLTREAAAVSVASRDLGRAQQFAPSPRWARRNFWFRRPGAAAAPAEGARRGPGVRVL